MTKTKWEWVWVHWFAAGCIITWYIMQGRSEPIVKAVPSLCAAVRDLALTNKRMGILASTKANNPTVQTAYEICWEHAPRTSVDLP
jgi:hypothetical protein